MSKSKSRQSSRQASAASKNGSSGASGKLTAKVAVADTPKSTEQEAPKAATEEASEVAAAKAATEKEESSEAKTVKATTDKTVTKKGTGEVAEKKDAPVAKAGSASSKTAPAKVSARAVPNTPPLKSIPNTPAGVGGRMQSRDAAKYERRLQERQMRYLAERRKRRNRALAIVSTVLAVALLATAGYYFIYIPNFVKSPVSKLPQGTYQEPIFNSTYPPVDSVYCDQLEQSVEHIHAYVAIYIDGKASPLPGGIGIPQDQSGNATCYYWLHTHDTSGVVHIESPSKEAFTVGQFINEWDQQFVSVGFPPELLLNTGWTVWVNGQKYNGSLSSIPLAAHNIITLAYGNTSGVKPVTTYNWNGL